jgi:hypothetical protein
MDANLKDGIYDNLFGEWFITEEITHINIR